MRSTAVHVFQLQLDCALTKQVKARVGCHRTPADDEDFSQNASTTTPNAGIPGRPVNAATEPSKPYVRPAGQYAMQAG